MIKNNAISDYAVVMVASKGGKTGPRIVFGMSLDDAKALCSDSRTSWKQSMAIWSHLSSFNGGFQGDSISLKRVVKDTGSMDDVIEELGLTVIPPSQFRSVFEPLGVRITA